MKVFKKVIRNNQKVQQMQEKRVITLSLSHGERQGVSKTHNAIDDGRWRIAKGRGEDKEEK